MGESGIELPVMRIGLPHYQRAELPAERGWFWTRDRAERGPKWLKIFNVERGANSLRCFSCGTKLARGQGSRYPQGSVIRVGVEKYSREARLLGQSLMPSLELPALVICQTETFSVMEILVIEHILIDSFSHAANGETARSDNRVCGKNVVFKARKTGLAKQAMGESWIELLARRIGLPMYQRSELPTEWAERSLSSSPKICNLVRS